MEGICHPLMQKGSLCELSALLFLADYSVFNILYIYDLYIYIYVIYAHVYRWMPGM